MPSEILDQIITTASQGDLDEAEARLQLFEEGRRRTQFIRYFQLAGDQQKLIDAMRERPHWKILLLLGGNGSGKSITGAAVTGAWLLGKDYFKDEVAWEWVKELPIPDGATNVRGVALNNDMLRDPMWENLLGSSDHPPMIPADEVSEKSTHLFTFRLKRGSKFHGKSADTDPKTHGGANCDLVWLDEEASKPIFDENYQRTRKGGRVLVTATPLDDVGTTAQPWIFDLIEKWKDGDPEIIVVFMSSLNNPYLSEDHKRQQLVKWAGHPEERARLYGEPVRRSGLYYKTWKFETPLWIPAYELPENGFRAVMIDPAVTGTVGALWAYFDRRGKMTLYREYKAKGLTVAQHVERMLVENRGDTINLWLADPFMGRQKVPDSVARDQHKTVLQVWRDAGLSRLQLPDIDYETCLARSHEYLQSAADPTAPHPSVEVFDHLSLWGEEIKRYVIDSVSQGQNRGEVRDKPRKGRDGMSTLMECFQYLAGMQLRSRNVAATASPTAKGTGSYFGGGSVSAPQTAPKPW